MPEVSPHLLTAHPEFFFPDGNIVLVAGILAFRLHRGVVNRWSPAFRAVLGALENETDSWKLEGHDVIVLDDDPLDVDRLVRMLYDGTATPIPPCTAETFSLISSLLILSHKYSIPHLHAHVLSRVLDAYPLTLDAWDTREAYTFTSSARRDRLVALRSQHAHPLAAVHLALQLGMPSLVVPAYLDLARFPVSEIIRGYTTATSTMHLPATQTSAVLRGKETLQRFIADFIKSSIEQRVPPPECPHIHLHGDQGMVYPCATAFGRVAHEMLVMTAGVTGGVDSDPLFVLSCAMEMLKNGLDEGIGTVNDDVEDSADAQERAGSEAACAACAEGFRQTVDIARQHIWGSLDKWFNLRKVLEGGFEVSGGWE